MRQDQYHHFLSDGILELIDPNDGQTSEPFNKRRFQWKIVGGWLLLKRILPARSIGNIWRDDIDEPWWRPVFRFPRCGPVLEFWEEHSSGMRAYLYEDSARRAVGHVVAYTPNGREVRRRDGLMEVQPHNDNTWARRKTNVEIKKAYWKDKKPEWQAAAVRTLLCDGPVSLLPIDVGFDLRRQDFTVQLKKGTAVDYLDDGEKKREIVTNDSALREAGYKVEVIE